MPEDDSERNRAAPTALCLVHLERRENLIFDVVCRLISGGLSRSGVDLHIGHNTADNAVRAGTIRLEP